MTNILIVDDDADLAHMVSILLKKAGMFVESINTGNVLFKTMDVFKPDIILMDIYLGEHDGRNLCRAIKSNATWKSIPVILYSAGNITPGSVRESLADAFIAKPFDNQEMVEKIRDLVK
jgi:DNA-binding response OmpR family regulator